MKNLNANYSRDVFIVDGMRSPYLKARTEAGPFSASDYATHVGRQLLLKQSFSPEDIQEVIVGCVNPSPDEANIARIIALRMGCGKKVPAYTVARNCASGMQSIDSGAKDIASGRCDLVMVGGTEAMSHTPLIWNRELTNWFSRLNASKDFMEKLKIAIRFKPSMLKPIIALLRGLNDPVVGLSMGQTAENLASQFGITREQMDEFALQSHQRVSAWYTNDFASEVVPMIDAKGTVYDKDDGFRTDSSLEKLGKLKAFFDKTYGSITPGNSSQITDGAAMLVLASEDAVTRFNLPVLGRIVDCEWAGLDPSVMGLGPVYAATPILQRHKLKLSNIDCWEINEAFAAQVLACVSAWENTEFCKDNLGLNKALGQIDPAVLNIDGGAIAIGHPVGSSGARIVLHLLRVLERKKAKLGMAAICIGGGQGGAMLVERV